MCLYPFPLSLSQTKCYTYIWKIYEISRVILKQFKGQIIATKTEGTDFFRWLTSFQVIAFQQQTI